MSKNTRNRILLTAVAALLLVTMAVGGTVAWLQADSDTVENTFTTSNIKVEIEETGTTPDTTDPTLEKKSYQFIPSVNLAKDPKVDAEANVPYYVFVEVKIDNWPYFTETVDGVTSEIKDANSKSLIEYTLNTTANGGVWSILEGYNNINNGSGTVVLYQEFSATTGGTLTDSPVLKAAYNGKEIYVSSELTDEDLAKITSTPKMTFEAYAMQKQNGDGNFTAVQAWEVLFPNP